MGKVGFYCTGKDYKSKSVLWGADKRFAGLLGPHPVRNSSTLQHAKPWTALLPVRSWRLVGWEQWDRLRPPWLALLVCLEHIVKRVSVSVAVFMACEDVEVAMGCRVVCRPALQHHHPATQTHFSLLSKEWNKTTSVFHSLTPDRRTEQLHKEFSKLWNVMKTQSLMFQ